VPVEELVDGTPRLLIGGRADDVRLDPGGELGSRHAAHPGVCELLFLRTYRHLYEAEKRTQALRLEAKILSDLDTIWTSEEGSAGFRLNEAEDGDGRT